MQLYAKLFVMLVIAAACHHFAPPSAWGGEAWFALRCHVANVLGDEKLAAQLVDEYYRAHKTIDERECEEVEFEFRLAAG